MGLSSAIHGGRGRGWWRSAIPLASVDPDMLILESFWVYILQIFHMFFEVIFENLHYLYAWHIFHSSYLAYHVIFLLDKGRITRIYQSWFFLLPPLWLLKLTHRMGFVMVPGTWLYIAHLVTFRVREVLEDGTWGYLPPVLCIHFVVHSCNSYTLLLLMKSPWTTN